MKNNLKRAFGTTGVFGAAFAFVLFLLSAVVAAQQKTPAQVAAVWPATMNPVSEIVIVAVDSNTLYYLGPEKSSRSNQAYTGPYPMHRMWHGRLVERLREAGARAVALDMLFQQTWDTRDDKIFTDAVAAGPMPVIAGFDIIPTPHAVNPQVDLRAYAIGKIGAGASLGRPAPALALPFEGLLKAGASAAGRSLYPDADGTLRRVDMFVSHQGLVLPSLSLAVFLAAIEASPSEVSVSGSGVSRAVTVRGRSVPLSQGDTLQVLFPPHKSVFKFVSYYDIVKVKDSFKAGAEEKHNEKMRELFKDRVVIVGYTDASTGELITTPAGAGYPRVEAIAAAANQMLNLYAGRNAVPARTSEPRPSPKIYSDPEINIERR
jgi:adenylate cyclase